VNSRALASALEWVSKILKRLSPQINTDTHRWKSKATTGFAQRFWFYLRSSVSICGFKLFFEMASSVRHISGRAPETASGSKAASASTYNLSIRLARASGQAL
jgi:hypothetical protein